jgi:hypothetical protein
MTRPTKNTTKTTQKHLAVVILLWLIYDPGPNVIKLFMSVIYEFFE